MLQRNSHCIYTTEGDMTNLILVQTLTNGLNWVRFEPDVCGLYCMWAKNMLN